MLNLQGAKDYIKDQFDNNNDSGWLEGWICGYTDRDHGYAETERMEVYEALFYHLDRLRQAGVGCKICGEWCNAETAHLHQDGYIGDECCWDERLKSSE